MRKALFGEENATTVESLNKIGMVLMWEGDLEKAEINFRRSL